MSNFESRNLIDYFALCGLDVKCGLESEHTDSYEEIIVKPPLERSYKCRMLYHFPENLPWNPFDEDAVAQLCFPNGLVFQKHSSRPRFHPFIITREDGSRVYGATLQFYELIEDESICNAMQMLQRMYDAEYTSTSTITSNNNRNSDSSFRSVYGRSSTANVSSTFESPTTTATRHSLNLQDNSNNNRSPFSTPVSSRLTDEENSSREFVELSPSVFLSSSSETAANGDAAYVGRNNNGLQSSVKQKLLSGNHHHYANSHHHHHHQHQTSSSSSSSHSPSKVSHYNMLKDRLYACKCICLISQQPFNRAFAKILHTLYDMVERTDLLGIRLEMHLHNLIYDIPMPSPGQLLKAHIGCKACYILAPGHNELPLLDYDLLEFFRLLGVHNAINLYLTTLLEHQILLYSKDYNLLMLVAESLTALLFPFQWIKTYVPIVPASNLHFIEAPLPYIMGFHHKDIDKEFFKQGQRCFVDIDSGTVSCPEGLPEFPDKNKFIKEINDLLVHFQEKRNLLKSSKQTAVEMAMVASTSSRRDSKSEQGAGDVANDSNGSSNLDILQNSQAFARIAELALKAGALDSSQDYFKITNRPTFNVPETPTSGSSGYSSSESTLTPNDTTKLNEYVSMSRRNSTQTPENCSSRTTSGGNSNDDNDELVLISAQFNACIRELFLLKFVQMLASYEKFVIVPSNIEAGQIDQWWMQREYSGVNFDSKMFLIEQPSPRLPFLSHFIATQMFVSFIDAKIISVIDPGSRNTSECLGVQVFDQRIQAFHDSTKTTEVDSSSSASSPATKVLFNVESIERDVAKKYAQEPLIAPSVKPVESSSQSESSSYSTLDDSNKKECRYLFENIDHSLLKADEDLLKKIYAEMKLNKENLLKKREQSRSSQLKLNSLERTKTTKERKARKPSDVKQKKSTPVIISSESIEKTTEINPIFIHSLLKESKSKTKRMLVEKMPEAANLGHGEARISGVEENMLIASLCDLIERIWGHGLHNKALSGKSALWNHLNNYRKLIQYLHPNSNLVADAKNTSPTLLWCLMKKKALVFSSYGAVAASSYSGGSSRNVAVLNDKTNRTNNLSSLLSNENSGLSLESSRNRSPGAGSCTLPRKQRYLLDEGKYSPNQHQSLHRLHGGGSTANLNDGSGQKSAHKRASSVVGNGIEQNQNTFPPLKNDLLADLARIDKLTEVKTEIGMARAFVRLSLEKKLLADHLRQLLSEAELLRALYKKHAFLRQEDEREQFIYHLQSLNVVDYFCFTDHFKSIPTDYSVLIVPSKKFSSSYTSANPYMKLFGSLGESDFIAIPKNTFEFTISCKNNLGPLTTLVIGHDNAGITPKWMIECIFVRNEITGHIHKFPCGRWLGKGVDDDSLERLLIAEPLDHNETYDLPNIQLLSPYSSTTTRSRSPTIIRADEKKLTPQAIQELLGNAINTLVKYFEKSEPERGSLTSLMCGDSGLVFCMDHIFSFGYKSYKLFKRLYVWDFFEKAAAEYENIFYSSSSSSSYSANEKQLKHHLQIEKYISVIRSINSTSANYGKDGKFQIFICLACRDSFLADWFQLLSKSNTASQMYDEYSFLRNHELHKLCMKLLSITNQFNFKLENSLTMGINY